MDISIDSVITVLLGVMALSASPTLSVVLFRVLVKDGIPIESQNFRHNHRVVSFWWLMMFLLGLFVIFFGGTISTPDRVREASIMCAVSLILVFSWFFMMLIWRSKLWAKWPDFTKAFPRHFFYLFHSLPLTWTVLLLYYLMKHFEGFLG